MPLPENRQLRQFLLFVFALIFLLWVVHAHLKPFEEIDSGVHEVIGGNHDYEFRHSYRDGMWASFAQSLNLLVGQLVGREMVDEEEFDRWAKRLLELHPVQSETIGRGNLNSTLRDEIPPSFGRSGTDG